MQENKRFLIAGLGNPGKKYASSRHNIGFMVVDQVAKTLNTEFRRMQSKAMVTTSQYFSNSVILIKPRTYMNNSGQAVNALVRFYKIDLENLLVIFDDADLDFEIIRLKPEGSSSGQQGMESVINSLGTDKFPRLRIGIGRPPGRMPTPNYVLQPFTKEEQEVLPFLIKRAVKAVLMFIDEDIESAMNQFN
jgi:PTH1 family peptidyl-tRNA hydrolase